MPLNFIALNNERVDIGNPSPLNMGSGDLTIMAWVKTTIIVQGNFMGKGGSFAGGKRYILAYEDGANAGRIKCDLDDDGPLPGVGKRTALSSSNSLNDGNWHHAAAVRDNAANLLRLYIDGVEDVTVDITGMDSLDSTRSAVLGAVLREDTGLPVEEYTGDIDDPRYYSRALSADEIQTIFTVRGIDMDVFDLQARFTLDEKSPGSTASGADVKDVGPNNLPTTTPGGSPTYVAGELRFLRRAL